MPTPDAIPMLYNFEDRHGNTFELTRADIAHMLRQDPDDGMPPHGLWAQDIDALIEKEAVWLELTELRAADFTPNEERWVQAFRATPRYPSAGL